MSQNQVTTVDPLRVFLHAVHFDYSSRRLEHIGREWLDAMPDSKRKVELVSGDVADSLIGDLADVPPTWIPMMVNSILSVELYLKAVIAQESGGTIPKRIHNLSQLFSTITDAGRVGIEALFKEAFLLDKVSQAKRDASATPEEWDLVPLLKRHDEAFAFIRYSYEKPIGWEYQSLISIRNAVWSYGLQVNPAWRAAAQRSGILPT